MANSERHFDDLSCRDRVSATHYSLFVVYVSRLRFRFLIARQHRVVGALPRREKVEIAELLVETDGLVEHPLLLVVIADFDEAGERKILAERMTVETIVGQEAPHVR